VRRASCGILPGVTKGGIPLTVLLGGLLAQQARPPTVRSRTTLVPVDVRVVDGGGNVTDLKQEDFTARGGIRQNVRFFTTRDDGRRAVNR
jgi:hypothetical protein